MTNLLKQDKTFEQKAEKYMHNCNSDKFHVFVMAKKKYVNQWSCVSLENARKSIQLFFKQCKLPRNKAIIKDENFILIEEIKNNQ